ncbi:MAG: carbon-nitrogen hydrolase family protein [Pseudomonadota bacterium]
MAKFAAIQMASGPNVDANLNEALRLIKDATKNGAELIVLPENFAHMGINDADILSLAEDQNNPGDILNFLSSTAKKLGIWILGGTVPLKTKDEKKILSASILYNSEGEIACSYNKIHLFDVDLAEDRGAYKESAFTQTGNELSVYNSPFGKLGLAICYDLRFPEMFRSLEKQGMQILLLPASFTSITGKAHWEVLNRARAIENLCYVVSSAQGGYHVNGRETHGDSMIVDPWGKIIDHLPKGSGYVIAELDLKQLNKTRENFPVLNHRKLFCNFTEIR